MAGCTEEPQCWTRTPKHGPHSRVTVKPSGELRAGQRWAEGQGAATRPSLSSSRSLLMAGGAPFPIKAASPRSVSIASTTGRVLIPSQAPHEGERDGFKFPARPDRFISTRSPPVRQKRRRCLHPSRPGGLQAADRRWPASLTLPGSAPGVPSETEELGSTKEVALLCAAAAIPPPKDLHPIARCDRGIAASLPWLPLPQPGPCRSGTRSRAGSPSHCSSGALTRVFLRLPESSSDLPSVSKPSRAGRGPGRGESRSSRQPFPGPCCREQRAPGEAADGHQQQVPAAAQRQAPRDPQIPWAPSSAAATAVGNHCGKLRSWPSREGAGKEKKKGKTTKNNPKRGAGSVQGSSRLISQRRQPGKALGKRELHAQLHPGAFYCETIAERSSSSLPALTHPHPRSCATLRLTLPVLLRGAAPGGSSPGVPAPGVHGSVMLQPAHANGKRCSARRARASPTAHASREPARRREFPPSPARPKNNNIKKKKPQPHATQHPSPSQASTCSACTTSPAPASSSPAGNGPRLRRGPRGSPCSQGSTHRR